MSRFDQWLAYVEQLSASPAAFAELYRELLSDSLEHEATDIHIHCSARELVIRYRIRGKLSRRGELPLYFVDSLSGAVKSHCGMDPFERRRPQDGRGTHLTETGSRSLRVSCLPATLGPSFVLRWVDEDSKCRQLHELGLLPQQESVLLGWLQRHNGWIVVGGPTGTGRRTIGHALLMVAKRSGKEVISLELQAGRPLPGILQINFREQSKLKESQWLQAALRRRPDALFFDRARDAETIEPLFTAARHNCLVIASMSRRFLDAPDYLEWMGGIPLRLSTQTLLGGMEQRLLPHVCPQCAERYTPRAAELRELRIHCDRPSELSFVKSSGCPACRGTGRAGFVGVHEVAEMTEQIREQLLERTSGETLHQELVAAGLTTFYESALHKLATRQIAGTSLFTHLRPQQRWFDLDAATGLCRH